MDRRSFLRLGVGGAALLAVQPVFGRDPALAQPAPGPFGHGVASGDPLADRVVLWTRVTPSGDATPGSGVGPPAQVEWEVAGDAAFATIVRAGTAATDAASDHTVKVDVHGLPSGTDLWYRFSAFGAVSPTGRTRTAPAPDADPAPGLRLGLVSCSNWEGGWFSAYRHLVERDDLDAVVHLGDYVYEYGAGRYGPGVGFGRVNDPDTEMVTLEHYRRRHALYKTDPDLAALHQRYAVIATIDDHEVTNNAWADGAENHNEGEGDFLARRAAAMQAYFEWMPIRATGGAAEPTRVYRSGAFGPLADLFVLDERTYRSHQPAGASGDILVTGPEPAEPGRTMLGADQLAWFEEGLATSAAPWKLVANPVMFAPLVLTDLPDLPGVTELLQSLLAGAGVGLPVVINGDQWDGYQAEQARLRERFGVAGGVVLLTGDIHSSWITEIPADPGLYLPAVGGESVAVEIVTPAVTSDSFSTAVSDLGVPEADQIAPHIPLIVKTAAPWFKYVEVEGQGFAVLDVTAEQVHVDLFHISDRTDRNATAALVASYRSPAGSNRLVPASPLGSRPAAAAPVPPATAAPTPARPTLPQTLPATGRSLPLAATAAAAAAGLALTAARRAAAPGADSGAPP
ncbi:MAG: alkaline phosphatase D family protein [Acidimicrobiales bacterium]|nr:alkaline phosphatase D family protein [Acidimicrobiales bacterium]